MVELKADWKCPICNGTVIIGDLNTRCDSCGLSLDLDTKQPITVEE